MLGFRGLTLTAGLFVGQCSCAQAIVPPFTNPRVLPNPAVAGEPVVARMFGDGCASWEPGEEVVTVQGNVVTLTHEADFICLLLPTFEFDFPLGTFPPGNYTLVYAPTSPFGNTYVTQTTQFTVLAAPAAIPTTSAVALGLIVFVLVMTAARKKIG